MIIRRKQKPKWWNLSHREEKRCQRCDKKIKMGRYCYYCGKYKGLW